MLRAKTRVPAFAAQGPAWSGLCLISRPSTPWAPRNEEAEGIQRALWEGSEGLGRGRKDLETVSEPGKLRSGGIEQLVQRGAPKGGEVQCEPHCLTQSCTPRGSLVV